MKLSHMITLTVILGVICLVPAAGLAEDTNIIFKHDQTGVADEVNKMKDFDFELQQRERDLIKRWNIEDSTDALNVGNVYYDKGELDEAIVYYQIAIKIDPANTEAHAKYIDARNIEKENSSDHYHRAMEYDRKGLKNRAIDELILEIKENPNNEDARIKLNEIEGR